MQDVMMNPMLSTWMWFEKATPNPSDRNRNTQLGCHLEEVAEMLEELITFDEDAGEAPSEDEIEIASTLSAISELAEKLKTGKIQINYEKINRKNLLDSLLDQIVTAIGVAHHNRMNPVDGLKEVNASNWSKFDTNGEPIRDHNQKIIKGPNYRKAVLDPFV